MAALADSPAQDVFAAVQAQGLNLHAVLDLHALPPEVRASLGVSDLSLYRQLVLLGHAGRDFWNALQRRGMHGSDPVDTFTTECVRHWMALQHPGVRWAQVFPGTAPVGLQRLGQLAGWHHAAPFGLGVNTPWGSWFAYRAVVLTNSDWATTPPLSNTHPCATCADQPCVTACPVDALNPAYPPAQRLHTCLAERQRPASPCMDRCLARQACPVGGEHRYTQAQTAYHYLQSLPMIRRCH